MLTYARRSTRRKFTKSLIRTVHTSSLCSAILQVHKVKGKEVDGGERATILESSTRRSGDVPEVIERAKLEKRNEMGVQMLSRRLHEQIFQNVSFPPPDRRYIRLAREHLKSHNLDITQGSILQNTDFTLPPLQGRTIDEHFFKIGSQVAEPWLTLAKDLASVDAPPKPEYWHIQPGWTKYYHSPDGCGYSESVSSPDEDMLVFDVETMPELHPYAVMACAMSKTHWYSWISPWLLGYSEEEGHLIPFGSPQSARIVVGHNVSYDRARIREEYHVSGTRTRFLDTMALHVAVKGISSHQRPAWMKYRKIKTEEKIKMEDALQAALEKLYEADEMHDMETDLVRKAELKRVKEEIEANLPQLIPDGLDEGAAEAEASSKRWEDITSANSLADVAKLHCRINLSKEVRGDFMNLSKEEILSNIQDYMDYCSTDVAVTHAVYAKVFPDYLKACPSPVSFAGIMTMGSSFLTVNHTWKEYLDNAERIYKELDEKIKQRLVMLAEVSKDKLADESWQGDPWLSQLDWTPKIPGKSRGVEAAVKSQDNEITQPSWYFRFVKNGPLSNVCKAQIIPLLLRLSFDGHPLQYSGSEGWTYVDGKGDICKPRSRSNTRIQTLLGVSARANIEKGHLTSAIEGDLIMELVKGTHSDEVVEELMRIADDVLSLDAATRNIDPWLSQLDWSDVTVRTTNEVETTQSPPQQIWPKWYWELSKPRKDAQPGSLNITVRNRFAPILLRLSWLGWPLFHSREHGWVFRVARNARFGTRQKALSFYDPADAKLQDSVLCEGFTFYKLPHKDGDKANVGSPLTKSFVMYSQDGTLTSPGDEAKDALDMNAQCSYWISSRDRIMKQMVVWDNEDTSLGLNKPKHEKTWGMILPQVISMGTVTRRAIEKTWLTASNAKANRVGSELKAMVRAPPGYAIVGADVDSEELWISSAMGDAQFGLHGATALGWMTLEGTKASGTDLHSRTASILGISRDQAKIFNYSRIYGAGIRHAILLLLQSNPNMLPEVAQKQAEKLYASTKGKNTHRADLFGRKFWFGGSESYVFNKLEEIALSDRPQTPALGCGVTHALSKEFLPPGFGADYMTSRINWVVQSSGVDYLHLLIVSMDHLFAKYEIHARYLISVHDEVRYLVKEEDRYRAALALQIANLWTRCQFAYRLGMDDLPQGVAFFSAVDIDSVLRKEVDLSCITPSQPKAIPPGESLNIFQTLEKTQGGSLHSDGRPMESSAPFLITPSEGYVTPDCMVHRASSAAFLRAQASSEFTEVKRLAELDAGQPFAGETGSLSMSKRGRPRKLRAVGNTNTVPTDSDIDRYKHVGSF